MLAAGEDGQWKDFLPPMGSGPDIPKLFKSASKARPWSCHSAFALLEHDAISSADVQRMSHSAERHNTRHCHGSRPHMLQVNVQS